MIYKRLETVPPLSTNALLGSHPRHRRERVEAADGVATRRVTALALAATLVAPHPEQLRRASSARSHDGRCANADADADAND